MIYLYLSCAVAMLCAVVHSYIGERTLVSSLTSRPPQVGVLQSLTWRRLVRAVWHLPSVFWALMSLMTLVLNQQSSVEVTPLYFVMAVYVFSGVGNFIATRGKHFRWTILLLAAALLWLGLPVSR